MEGVALATPQSKQVTSRKAKKVIGSERLRGLNIYSFLVQAAIGLSGEDSVLETCGQSCPLFYGLSIGANLNCTRTR
jgi:hypothetical protein